MSRCRSCDRVMNDFEMTRRYAESLEFVDLCNKCISTIPNFPPTVDREDLAHNDSGQEPCE